MDEREVTGQPDTILLMNLGRLNIKSSNPLISLPTYNCSPPFHTLLDLLLFPSFNLLQIISLSNE